MPSTHLPGTDTCDILRFIFGSLGVTALTVSARHPNIGTARRFTTRQKWTEWSQLLWSTERCGACSKETDTIATRQIFLIPRIVIQILGCLQLLENMGKTYQFTMTWANSSNVTRRGNAHATQLHMPPEVRKWFKHISNDKKVSFLCDILPNLTVCKSHTLS